MSSQLALAIHGIVMATVREPQLNNPEPAHKRCRCAAQPFSRPTIRAGF
jgi:hypothetical protein